MTTADRIRRALPEPWHMWSVRTRGVSEWWIAYGRYPMMPLGSGLRVGPRGITLPDGTMMMTMDDIAAESAAADARAEEAERKRTARIAAQHARGEAGAYGYDRLYLYRSPWGELHEWALSTWKPWGGCGYGKPEPEYRLVTMRAYHPKANRGPLHDDCPSCRQRTSETIARETAS